MPASSVTPLKGVSASRCHRIASILLAGLGVLVALTTIIGVLAASTSDAWVLGSFGDSCILLFGFPVILPTLVGACVLVLISRAYRAALRRYLQR